MRLSWVLSAVVASVVSVAQASSLLAIAAEMPTCGLSCLEKEILASPCDLTDTTCSCSNATLTAQITLCVTESCTIREQLSSKNATETLCEAPVRNRTKAVSYTGVIGGILALIAYVLRMVARLPQFGGQLGADDYVMTATVLLVAPLTCLSVVLADAGLGRDMWAIPAKNITRILYIYYIDEDLYLTALPMLKISICCFYLRIFPDRNFRKAVFGVIALCAAYGIAFLLVSVFQCRPISYAWNQWDGEHSGSCNNINAQGWTSAALNIVLDLAVIILPLPYLAKLQLNMRKKVLLMLMFCLGFFITIVSILRLRALIEFGDTSNITWDYVSVGYWSTIELHTGIICACLPGMRALAVTFMPKIMGKSTAQESNGYSGQVPTIKRTPTFPVSTMAKNGDDGDFVPLVDVESQAGRPEDKSIYKSQASETCSIREEKDELTVNHHLSHKDNFDKLELPSFSPMSNISAICYADQSQTQDEGKPRVSWSRGSRFSKA